MKVVQCKKGHYYDAEKYDECPMCKKILFKKTLTKIIVTLITAVQHLEFSKTKLI